MKIKLESILNKSKDRPAGYYEDVISHGIIINDYLDIDEHQFNKLKEKYNSQQVIINNLNTGINELPSLFQQAKNLATSTFNHVINGMEEVSLPIYEERLKTCMNCPFVNTSDAENPRCSKCGCFLKIKAKWASERCPDTPRKWDVVPTQKMGGCGSCGGT
jgi:hypothetical protein